MSQALLARQIARLAAYKVQKRQQAQGGTSHPSRSTLEADWRHWLRHLYPQHIGEAFADHQAELWTWAWSIRPGLRPRPFVAIWPRGGAKSTTAELAAVSLGCRRLRKYGLVISSTQDQADDHVSNIGSLLENPRLEALYPDMANRLVGKYGHSKGWRRNRLRTRSRFTIDAMGLDSAARGAKLEEMRPDLMLCDDLDNEDDSLATIQHKLTLLSRKLLPAGTSDGTVLAVQNLIHPNGIFARLADRD